LKIKRIKLNMSPLRHIGVIPNFTHPESNLIPFILMSVLNFYTVLGIGGQYV